MEDARHNTSAIGISDLPGGWRAPYPFGASGPDMEDDTDREDESQGQGLEHPFITAPFGFSPETTCQVTDRPFEPTRTIEPDLPVVTDTPFGPPRVNRPALSMDINMQFVLMSGLFVVALYVLYKSNKN